MFGMFQSVFGTVTVKNSTAESDEIKYSDRNAGTKNDSPFENFWTLSFPSYLHLTLRLPFVIKYTHGLSFDSQTLSNFPSL